MTKIPRGAARPIITYPTRWLLAVIDDPVAATAAADALRSSGLDADRVRVLIGPDGRMNLGELGSSTSWLARIIRIIQFTTMDQMPNFPAYEAALDGGRAIVAVQASGRTELAAARVVLARHGAHFENYFGRFATEEFSRWRGPEPDLPSSRRR